MEFFEAMYQRSADPWNFATSRYELNRYARIVASLQGRNFERGFEAGCSIGVLTQQLAALCTSLTAMDVSPTAVAQARQRCGQLANVDIQVGSLATDVPRGPFDLVVLSEIGYYFEAEELRTIGTTLSCRLRSGGVLLGAHWLGHSDDHVLSGDQVHEIVGSLPELEVTLSERHEGYRMEHFTKAYPGIKA